MPVLCLSGNGMICGIMPFPILSAMDSAGKGVVRAGAFVV